MVSNNAFLGLSIALAISLLSPVVVWAVARRRMTLAWRNIGLGAAIFFLFVLVLESLMHMYVLKLNPVSSAWLKANVWGFAAYAAGAAALFEETGRYLALRLFAKPSGDAGTAVAYGLGHGGLEAWLIGAFGQLQAMIMAVMLNAGTLQTLLGSKLQPEAYAKIYDKLAHLTFIEGLIGGIERFWALLFQIGFSFLVWRAVSRRKLGWLLAAIGAHAALDAVAALYQRGVVSLAATEAYVTVLGVVLLAVFLVRLPQKTA